MFLIKFINSNLSYHFYPSILLTRPIKISKVLTQPFHNIYSVKQFSNFHKQSEEEIIENAYLLGATTNYLRDIFEH
ncbi:hypothetical protein GAI15033_11310 [Parvimonas parva]